MQPPANRGRRSDQKSAPHMLADERARIAASSRKTPAEESRQEGPASGQQQQEIHGSQKERGAALSAKNLKERNDEQHRDGKVHSERMEAANKLHQRRTLDSVGRRKQQEGRQDQ